MPRTMTPAHTMMNANSVPIEHSSEDDVDRREGRGDGHDAPGEPGRDVRRPEARWTRDRKGGRSPSRDIANRIRGWPMMSTSRTLVMPAMAPTLMRTEAQGILSVLSTSAIGSATPSSRVGHDAGHDRGHGHVEDRGHDERAHDADGQVALRVLGLLGRRRDRVEPHVGQEDDARAAVITPLKPKGMNGCQLAGFDVADGEPG